MGSRGAQPPSDGDEHLLRQVVDLPLASPAQILPPVALRAVALQRDEALEAAVPPNWIDAALLYGERLVACVLVVFVAFRIVDGPIRDWAHARTASAQVPAHVQRVVAVEPPAQAQRTVDVESRALARGAVDVEARSQSRKVTTVRRPARHPELGRSLPSTGPRLRRPAVAVDYLVPARAFVPATVPVQRAVEAVVKPTPVPDPKLARNVSRTTLLPIAPIIKPESPRDLRPTHLRAPSVGLDAAVVEVFLEDGVWQVADYAAGYHHGTGLPGEGNTVMAGHKGLRGAVFARLEALKVGDEIFVDTVDRRFRYQVRETRSVWPSEVDIMFPTLTPTLTLLTCTNWDMQRFVVIADLVDSAELSTSGGG